MNQSKVEDSSLTAKPTLHLEVNLHHAHSKLIVVNKLCGKLGKVQIGASYAHLEGHGFLGRPWAIFSCQTQQAPSKTRSKDRESMHGWRGWGKEQEWTDFGVSISLYFRRSTRVEAAMLYGMTMLLMSYALSPRRLRQAASRSSR